MGGLSRIDYDATNQRYIAISDDRSSLNPARYYSLTLDLSKFARSATPGMAGVGLTGVTTIQQPGGGACASNTVDPEGIRLNATTGTLYWSNERQRSGAGFQEPTVRDMNLNGTHVREFIVPSYYHPTGSIPGLTPGDK